MQVKRDYNHYVLLANQLIDQYKYHVFSTNSINHENFPINLHVYFELVWLYSCHYFQIIIL